MMKYNYDPNLMEDPAPILLKNHVAPRLKLSIDTKYRSQSQEYDKSLSSFYIHQLDKVINPLRNKSLEITKLKGYSRSTRSLDQKELQFGYLFTIQPKKSNNLDNSVISLDSGNSFLKSYDISENQKYVDELYEFEEGTKNINLQKGYSAYNEKQQQTPARISSILKHPTFDKTPKSKQHVSFKLPSLKEQSQQKSIKINVISVKNLK